MSTSRTRWGALTLAVAGVLFILYPAVRPWQDESTVHGAIKAMSSGAWVAAHLFAMVGFILVALGLLAVWNAVSTTRSERLGFAAVVTTWVGVGLTLPYYGAEDFGLNAIARKAAEGQRFDLLGVVDAVRFSPVPATTFFLGLLLLGGRRGAGGRCDLALGRAAALQRHPVRARLRPVHSAVLPAPSRPDRTQRAGCRRVDLGGAGAVAHERRRSSDRAEAGGFADGQLAGTTLMGAVAAGTEASHLGT
jgi:hypothetical protein